MRIFTSGAYELQGAAGIEAARRLPSNRKPGRSRAARLSGFSAAREPLLLGQDFRDHFSGHVGQPEVAPLMANGKSPVVDA